MIAAFPPPVVGQSLAAKLLYEGIRHDHEVFRIDISEPIEGDPLVRRLLTLAGAQGRLLLLCLIHSDLVVYFQLGHGRAALLRDFFFMLTARATRCPCVAHVHGSGFRVALESLPAPLRQMEKKLIGGLKAAVVLSPSLRGLFDGLLDGTRVFHVDNGIDPSFVALAEKAPPARAPRRMNILFLSNLLAAKGFATLLEAAGRAFERGKDWKFIFVGAKVPGQGVDIDAWVSGSGLKNVEVRDAVEGAAKHGVYQEASIFALPSYYEGQPLCILEALFEALPVVTTRVGGIPEIFGETPCVRFVKPGDAQGLYAELESLEPPEVRLEMSRAARELAFSRFTADRHIGRMASILD